MPAVSGGSEGGQRARPAWYHHETVRRHADGAPLPEFAEHEFRDFLTCGVLAHGFARLRCPGGALEHCVPFSCKGRGFCPSCGGRRMTEFAARLVDEVLPRVPVRQRVLRLPYRLRHLPAWDHGLARAVLAVYVRVLLGFQRSGAPSRDPGRPVGIGDRDPAVWGRTQSRGGRRHARADRRAGAAAAQAARAQNHEISLGSDSFNVLSGDGAYGGATASAVFWTSHLARSLAELGDFAAARGAAADARRLMAPLHHPFLTVHASCSAATVALRQDRADEVIPLIEGLREITMAGSALVVFPVNEWFLAYAYALVGHPGAADLLRRMERLTDDARFTYYYPFWLMLGEGYLLLGEPEERWPAPDARSSRRARAGSGASRAGASGSPARRARPCARRRSRRSRTATGPRWRSPRSSAWSRCAPIATWGSAAWPAAGAGPPRPSTTTASPVRCSRRWG
jgi:hypothetical protein